MKANEIYQLAKNIHKSPYKNIMIDGCWGVGKSYEIQRALEENSKSCILSIFGINNCKEIFSSLVFKLECKNAIVEKACNVTASIVKAALEHFGVNDVFPGASKEATFQLLKYLKDDYIIVFDDLERAGRDFNFEEFLGIIEELKQLNSIKVILIANTNKFNDANKDVYSKYHEKVIDKIYKIEQLSSDINWENIGVEDRFFTEEYIDNFNIKNLRTIQKAEQFFKDIKIKIDEDKINIEDNFLDIIKKICYSIAVEDIEKLGKLKFEQQRDSKLSNSSLFYEFYDEEGDKFAATVGRYYLKEFKEDIFNPIIKMLCDYYNNNDFDIECINDGIKLYKKMGEKLNFFKSDDELHKMIEKLKKEFLDSNNFLEALKQADIILVWMDVLEIDSTELFSQMKERLEKLMDDAIDKDIKIDEFHTLWLLNGEKLKDYTKELFKSLDKKTFEKHVSSIKMFENSGDYSKAYMKIKDISDREWKGVEESKFEELLNPEILPLGSIVEEQWKMFKALKDLFMETDDRHKLWDEYIKNAKENNKSDKAFLNRLNRIDIKSQG